MDKILKHGGWNLLAGDQHDPQELISLFELIRSGHYEAGNFLKEHHRSIVRRFNYKGRELVVKIPLEKNQRHWIRFTTLFRSGEAFKNLRGMKLLAARNVPSTIPVMAAESRRFGMVTDSFMIYEYLDGQSCQDREEVYPDVVKRLASMHGKGLLHGDSQIRNFLLKDQTIYVIDSNPQPTTPYNKAYEYAYLRKSAPGIERYFGNILQSRWYTFAEESLYFDRRLSHFRQRLRKFLGIKTKQG